MKNNIIASIALFQSLYDNGKLDIFSVIAKFVQSTIQMNNLYSFDTNQLKSQLKNDFETVSYTHLTLPTNSLV